MPLLNYTTTIEATKTVGEIQLILMSHGARSLLLDCKDGTIDGISFIVSTSKGEISFRLPVKTEAAFRKLQGMHPKQRKCPDYAVKDKAQAIRVAWRITKDWVEAQMALIELGMASLEEVFLPYALLASGETVYQALERTNFRMISSGKVEAGND